MNLSVCVLVCQSPTPKPAELMLGRPANTGQKSTPRSVCPWVPLLDTDTTWCKCEDMAKQDIISVTLESVGLEIKQLSEQRGSSVVFHMMAWLFSCGFFLLLLLNLCFKQTKEKPDNSPVFPKYMKITFNFRLFQPLPSYNRNSWNTFYECISLMTESLKITQIEIINKEEIWFPFNIRWHSG